MLRAGPLLLLLLLAACAAAEDAGSPGEDVPAPETTAVSRDLDVKRISAEAPGQGPQRPRVVLSPSAATLSEEVGARVPDSGEGIYVAAYSGEKPTGGHSINVLGARLEGDRLTVRLALKGPPEGAIVTQVLTYPYVIAVVKGVDAQGKELVFVDQDGRRLDWPVRRVGG